MALALNIGKCTLLGNYRENNEDSIDVKPFPDMTVCLVADGMGGQAAGEVASKRAVEIVPRELKKHLGASVSNDEAKMIVRRAVVQANEEIMSLAALDRELKNMGTTIVANAVAQRQQSDVRGRHGRQPRLPHPRQKNRTTHRRSFHRPGAGRGQNHLRRRGRTHRYRNVLWKYLGSAEVGEGPEVKVVPMQAGDRFLLCTDGLSGVVSDEQLLNYMKDKPDNQECADGLCQLALDQGSRDNVSAIVVEVGESKK